jgi:serine/threonine protein kinase
MTMFHQLLQAVAYLHENGIAHRDIKPANILVLTMQPQPLIQLTDFGCASDEAGWVYDDAKPVGTVPFLAPEQVSGTRYGRGIDVWASGVVGLVLSGFDIGGRLLPRTDGVLEGMLGKLGDSGGKLGACLTEMLRTNAADRIDAATALDIVGKLLRGGGGGDGAEDNDSNVGSTKAKKGKKG